MNRHVLSNLVMQSYTKGNLDPQKVVVIADILNRRQLKEYIRALKEEENKRSVKVELTRLPKRNEDKEFMQLFPGKKIIFNYNPELLAGIKVKNNDIIYELDLKNTLDKLIDHIAEDI